MTKSVYNQSTIYLLRLMLCAIFVLGIFTFSQAAFAQRIFTCTDEYGRKLTSDRPILACLNRQQKELNRTGSLKRIIDPAMTVAQKEAKEKQDRLDKIAREKEKSMRMRDQALLVRYPDKATHEKARLQTLEQSNQIIASAKKIIEQLEKEKKEMAKELADFYQNDISKASTRFRRTYEGKTDSIKEQEKTIKNQQNEQQRINNQFQEEEKRLVPLWQAATRKE